MIKEATLKEIAPPTTTVNIKKYRFSNSNIEKPPKPKALLENEFTQITFLRAAHSNNEAHK
jgi:hypothetical protein